MIKFSNTSVLLFAGAIFTTILGCSDASGPNKSSTNLDDLPISIRQEVTKEVSTAPYIVIDSSTENLKIGGKLEAGTQVILSANESISLLLPNGATKEILGPFEGQLAEIKDAYTGNQQWVEIVTDLLSKKGNDEHVGAVRGEYQNPKTLYVPFEGQFCVAADHPIIVARSGRPRSDLIFYIQAEGRPEVELKIKKGDSILDQLPNDLLREGQFKMHTNEGPPWYESYAFTIVEVPAFSIPELANHKCESQLRNLLFSYNDD